MTDEELMRRALDLAKKGEGWTAPNPMVGAVIFNDDKIVGEGFHQRAGTPHAEVLALQSAKELARGASVYVTLEPCCHYGRTPPCTDALIKAEVAKVVVAMADPNPKVAGGGIKKLREAGIEVFTGVLAQEAKKLNEIYIKSITKQMPFVALKSALTLDGKTASRTGDSKWITGEKSREQVHKMRHKYDAILVGIGTVLADDPLLTTRIPGLKNPLRVILDSTLKIPIDAKVLDTKTCPTIIFTAQCLKGFSKARRIEEKGVEIIECPGEGGRVNLITVLDVLFQKGVTSILVEGGSEISGAFFDGQLVDKIYLFFAPKLIGGCGAPGMIGGLGIGEMNKAEAVENLTIETIGNDILITGYPKYCNQTGL